ncbi:MAG: fasciclin domain-containing protein [Chitinophagaceae bacterium]
MTKKSLSIYGLLLVLVLSSCSKNGHIIGGDRNETNEVNMSTFDFLKSFDVTTSTARLIEKAGLKDEVNGNVTVIAPSNFAVNRYLRRKNNRLLRLDPNAKEMTIEDIPVVELEQLKMYIVDGSFLSTDLTPEGILLPTHHAGDSLRLSLVEATAEPGAAWDGGGQPGQGYQYSNFMQSRPQKVTVHFKRGANWEMSGATRTAMGMDNPECDQVYKMYISDVKTTNGVVHVIYSGDYSYTDHYYYHSLFFFGTRADDLL